MHLKQAGRLLWSASCRASEIIGTYMVVGEVRVVMGHPLGVIPQLKTLDHSESGKMDMDTKLITSQHLDSVACEMTNYNFILQLHLPLKLIQCGCEQVFDVSGFLAMVDKCICTACCVM